MARAKEVHTRPNSRAAVSVSKTLTRYTPKSLWSHITSSLLKISIDHVNLQNSMRVQWTGTVPMHNFNNGWLREWMIEKVHMATQCQSVNDEILGPRANLDEASDALIRPVTMLLHTNETSGKSVVRKAALLWDVDLEIYCYLRFIC